MPDKTVKAAVIGSGIMGLTAGYELLKKGYDVSIFEKDDRVGGMSASFDFSGLSIERYYHFVCKPDQPLFELLKALNIFHALKWKNTKMGYFYNGHLYKWGNPLYLLAFPEMDMVSKIRYGWHISSTARMKQFDKLDKLNAIPWLKRQVGEKAYDIFWRSLFDLKFYDKKDNLSAAWIGARIRRMALSRKNMFTETLGYLEGGSKHLFDTMSEKIKMMGGKLHTSTGVERIMIGKRGVKGVVINNRKLCFDTVISTIPIPYIVDIVPDMPKQLKNRYLRLKNFGVVCPLFKLKHSITDNFWLNINDRRLEVPGIIEFSKLNPLGSHIVYFPYYLPNDHPKFNKPDDFFIREAVDCFKILNPQFQTEWIVDCVVHRNEFAQPLCPPGFSEMLPPIKSEISGLFIADTAYSYPEDRSLSESIALGKKIVRELTGDPDGYQKTI